MRQSKLTVNLKVINLSKEQLDKLHKEIDTMSVLYGENHSNHEYLSINMAASHFKGLWILDITGVTSVNTMSMFNNFADKNVKPVINLLDINNNELINLPLKTNGFQGDFNSKLIIDNYSGKVIGDVVFDITYDYSKVTTDNK